ncbi:MAG TPA: trigger factor [Chloroflexota bacterium]|nr:trigger factor [Chloroflexota bacterium]
MKVTTEKLPDSQVLLNIEVEPEQVAQSVERAYQSIAARVDVPGFRRGKAPRYLVERLISREAVVAEGIERLVPKVYEKALEESGIEPIDQPEFDLEPNLEEATTQPLIIKATVPVQPTVELGDYKAIRLSPVPVDVTPEMINNTIERLRENAASWTPVERPTKVGDQVVADIEGRVGTAPALYSPAGEPILSTVGGQVVVDDKNSTVVIDAEQGQPTPTFHQELIGLSPGSEKTFQVSLPAEYPDRALASKAVTFKVTIHEVKEKNLPEIDDEVAKSVGEYETVDALRKAVEDSLRSNLEQEAQRHFEESVVREVVEGASIDMPPVLVNREVDRMVRNMSERLRQQRLNLEQYLRAVGKSDSQFREEMRPSAIDNLKNYLVLREVGKSEGIAIAEPEVEQEIDRIASTVGGENADQIREVLDRPAERADIESSLWHRRVMAALTGYARGEDAASSEGEVNSAELPDDSEADEAEDVVSATPSGEAATARTPESQQSNSTATDRSDDSAAASANATEDEAGDEAPESEGTAGAKPKRSKK